MRKLLSVLSSTLQGGVRGGLLFVALFATTTLLAHDFEVDNIFYNILDENNLAVTHRGSSYNEYSNEYSGEVIIPENVTYNATTYSVTSIGEDAFHFCSSLTSVTIPNSVTSIESCAFDYCSSLTSITIPESVTSIGNYAFYWCQSLESIVVEQGNVTYDSRENCNAIIETASNTLIIGCKNTTIPNSVTSIGENAFFDCQNLNSIVIPNNITNIGESAFGGCISLASITIPNSVIDIGEWAFGECISLASCTIGNGVRSIGYAAFYGCIFTSITIPKSVTNIGEFAFGACYALTSISIENGNTQYDSRDNCNAIIETATNTLIAGCQNTIIPNSVTSIGDDAFHACFTLTSITIPNSVTSIGSEAFVSCESLTTVICKAIEVPELESNVFNRMPLSEATLYVAAESIEKYKSADQWKDFGTILPIHESPTNIEHTPLGEIGNQSKLLRNGQLLILRDGKTYTITGQKL